MRLSVILFVLIGYSAMGQSLANLNLNYWYDPNTAFEFVMTPVKAGGDVLVYYQLYVNRRENNVNTFSITWESREDLTDRTGQPLTSEDSIISKTEAFLSGITRVPSTPDLWYITAKITNTATQESFYFYKPVDPLWPVDNIITVNGAPLLKTYVVSGSTVALNTGKKAYGFYYKKVFNQALPPHSDPLSVDPFLKADSVFVVNGSFTPRSNGLYLFQEDTTSNNGYSILVGDPSYPKYNRIPSLAGPLVYICTDDEYKQLKAAGNDKAAFDRVILDITGDKDRARNFMRSYFQRVEAANRYFTEYKEGWKTDRGMIYIIYGLPDEVSRMADKEIWNYKGHKTKFVFTRSKSIFTPESYKLKREGEYVMRWFSLIDLWRKSRF